MFEPRLKHSSKHRPKNLPEDLLKLAKDAFKEKYSEFLNNKDLKVEGVIYPEELILLVGFIEKNSIRQFNFECSMDYSEESKVMDLIHLSIDAIDSMFSQEVVARSHYTEETPLENEVDWPKAWTSFPFEDKKVYLKVSSVNTDIEKMTSKFLLENDVTLLEDSVLNESPADLH